MQTSYIFFRSFLFLASIKNSFMQIFPPTTSNQRINFKQTLLICWPFPIMSVQAFQYLWQHNHSAMSKPTGEGNNHIGKCIMMGTYRCKDICKGGEIYKKVMKILMEVLFFVFDNNALYLKKLILPKAIKADQKYNCCCEGTMFWHLFLSWTKIKTWTIGTFCQMGSLKDRNFEMFHCSCLCILLHWMQGLLWAGWKLLQ